jgi:outer membrane protein OmpA-like peptidoglycan-associated protein
MQRLLPVLVLLGSGCLAEPGQARMGAAPPQGRAMTQVNAAELANAIDQTGSIVLTTVQFEEDTAAIAQASHSTLSAVGELLTRNPGLTLEIQGHTESAGAGAAALELSQARAEAVRDYVVTNFRVAPERLTAVGFGGSKPLAGRAGRSTGGQNARIELVKTDGRTNMTPTPPPPAPPPPTSDGPGEWTGRVMTGMMAVGGETTGILLAVGEPGTGDRFELQPANQAMRERLRALDGRTVTVRGTLDTREGVEVRRRRILTVTEIVE